jgi:hypothetical protein
MNQEKSRALRLVSFILHPSSFILCFLAICLAAMALHAYPLFHPMIMFDDFELIAKSLTWRAAQSNLWVPANEHAMPLGRLSTWALVQMAGPVTAIPAAVDLQGPLAQLAGMLLLYVLVRRELGHPFYGLVAMALFGISAIYHQAVTWFAASFSILALDMLLLALLAAQTWRQTGRLRHLASCVLATGLAPCWFASGILAGPICCLFLLGAHSRQHTVDSSRESQANETGNRPNFWFYCLLSTGYWLLPLLGTLIFLAVSLPFTAGAIMHLEHYGGKTALEAFDLKIGARNMCRSIADSLIPAILGFYDVYFPWFVVAGILVLLGAFVIWWWRPVSRRAFLYSGLGLILLSYLLAYSARADWDDGGYNLSQPGWSRYHLLPQLGLVLVICGGLPRWEKRFHHFLPSERLSSAHVWAVGLLIVFLLITQFPRGLVTSPAYLPRQQEVLRRIAEVDASCRRHHISGETARAALGTLEVPWCGSTDNGWDLLRGSDDPKPITVEDARRLLNP